MAAGWENNTLPYLSLCNTDTMLGLCLDNLRTNIKVILVSSAYLFEIGNTENIGQYSTGNFEAVLNKLKILKMSLTVRTGEVKTTIPPVLSLFVA